MSKLLKYFGIDVKKKDYIFKEGDAADYLYMIHKGEIVINRVVNGVEEEIQHLRDGEFVGEMAIIDSKKRSANAIAVTDCQLIRMNRESFESTFQKNPQMGISFLAFLSNRIRETNDLLTAYMQKNREVSFELELAKEAVSKNRKDKSGKWYLLNYTDFVASMVKRTSYNAKETDGIIRSIVQSRKNMRILKTPSQKELIAYTLGY